MSFFAKKGNWHPAGPVLYCREMDTAGGMGLKRYLLSLLAVVLLSGCTPDDPAEPGTRPEVQKEEREEVPDPTVEVEGTWAFAEMGADIEAPVGAENARYFIVSDRIAEIQFTRNDVPYRYQASQKEDLTGFSQGAQKTQEAEGPEAVVGSSVIPIEGSDGRFSAAWRWGGTSYRLIADEQVDGQIMKSLVEELARETMPLRI